MNYELYSRLSQAKLEDLRREARQQHSYRSAFAPRSSLRAKLASVLRQLAERLETQAKPEPEHS